MGIQFGESIWLAFPITAAAGLISGLSPCTLPTVLLVAGYVSGKAKLGRRQGFWLSLLFVIGTAITWSLLGAFAGFLGAQLAEAWWFNLVLSATLVLMGLWLLGVLDFSRAGGGQVRARQGSGALGAALLGLLMAVSASTCTLPVALSVMAYASTRGSMLYGALLMGVFALSRGIPLVIVGTFSGWLQSLQRFARYQSMIEKAAGLLLLGLGVYYLAL